MISNVFHHSEVPGSFILSTEPVALKFSTPPIPPPPAIGAASFQHNMKWAQNALCVAITDSPILKNISTWNVWCVLVQATMVSEKKMIRH